MEQTWANPSSVHRAGQEARRTVELARQQLAQLIGARARDVTLCASGTESVHLAIRGSLPAKAERRVLVTSDIEHAAVRDLAEILARDEGVEIRRLPILPGGVVDADAIGNALEGCDPASTIVSVQWANNETGVIQPAERLGAACRQLGVRFHCDATQWIGKLPAADHDPPIADWCDLLTCSAHKFHGPKGVGVLWARRGIGLRVTVPGSQELGRRGGTENVPGIAGAGAAAAEALAFVNDASHIEAGAARRDRFERGVLDRCAGAVVNGGEHPRLWNTTNIGFPRLEAEAMLVLLSERGVAASAGAACSSGSLEPSPVLLAMGVPPEIAHGSVRFSISRLTTDQDVERGIEAVAACVAQLGRSGF